MTVQWGAMRLFQRALMLWVIGFMISAYWGLDELNVMGLSPIYAPPGPLKYITHAVALLPDGVRDLVVLVVVLALLVLCLRDLFRSPRWWSALLIWLLHANLMNNAWLAGSGGQQLVANLLFCNIFLSLGSAHAVFFGLWSARMQLLLAYFTTGLHKLTGTHWTDGTAMGIVATDPAFGPLWLGDMPVLSAVLTWSVLVFQLTFPLAVWFRPTRHAWMLFGLVFHLGTAIWMDIPEMGLAFIASYALWLDDATVQRLAPLRWLAAPRRSVA